MWTFIFAEKKTICNGLHSVDYYSQQRFFLYEKHFTHKIALQYVHVCECVWRG